LRLTSTVPDYVALAAIADDEVRERAWVERYEAAHPAIFEVYYRAWGLTEKRAEAARDVPRLAPTMAALEVRARGLADDAETFFRSEGLIDDDLDVVLMVGGHTSDGWVTELGGRTTLFIAVEFLGDPPFDAILLSHEAFHVAHSRYGAETWPEDCASSLFQEGFAVAVTRDLHPGLAESAYLWFDGAHGDWVDDCVRLAPRIAARALAELDTSYDELRVRTLFTTRADEEGLPSRCGYWLGDRLLSGLLRGHPMRELLAWDHPTARDALATELTSLIEGPIPG
jgi:hypothetical protein